MKRQYRVRSRGEFQRVYQEGRSFANRAAVLYVLGSREGGPRAGFAAGRKLGSAVVRNRVKRRLREAVRMLWSRVRGAALLVFIARGPVRDMPFAELKERVAELLQRAGVLAPEGDTGGRSAGRAAGKDLGGPVDGRSGTRAKR